MGYGAVTLNVPTGEVKQSESEYATGITGAESVLKTGSGTFLYDVANSYTGTTTVEAGTLQISSLFGGYGSVGTMTVKKGATLDILQTGVFYHPLNMDGGTHLVNNNVTYAAAITAVAQTESVLEVAGNQSMNIRRAFSGAGTLTKTGTGGIQLNGTGAVDVTTFTGKYIQEEGYLRITSANENPTMSQTSRNASYVTGVEGKVSGGFQIYSTNPNQIHLWGDLSGTGDVVIQGSSSSSASMQVGFLGNDSELSGNLLGTSEHLLKVEKVGAGTWTLSGTNSNVQMTVSEGTMRWLSNGAGGGSSASGARVTTVKTGGTLEIGNALTVFNEILLEGGTLEVASGFRFTHAGLLTMAEGTSSTVDVAGTYNMRRPMAGTGTVTKTGTGYVVIDAFYNAENFHGTWINQEGKTIWAINGNSSDVSTVNNYWMTSPTATYVTGVEGFQSDGLEIYSGNEALTYRIGMLEGTGNLTQKADSQDKVSIQVGNKGTDGTLSGSIVGLENHGFAFEKVGEGTWTLAGDNRRSYADFKITAGILEVAGSLKARSLDLAGGDFLLDYHAGMDVGVETLSLLDDSAFWISLESYAGDDAVLFSVTDFGEVFLENGIMQISESLYPYFNTVVDLGGDLYQLTRQSSVPEPATWGLFLGLLGCWWAGKCRNFPKRGK
ncbi:MAG: autotransporter-associated beta strand repeat-containing protein [Planctomycetia bacterium]|nr:autotransporter-associated beta strand repeat-containing protein [Planctomycetia bacterium]